MTRLLIVNTVVGCVYTHICTCVYTHIHCIFIAGMMPEQNTLNLLPKTTVRLLSIMMLLLHALTLSSASGGYIGNYLHIHTLILPI